MGKKKPGHVYAFSNGTEYMDWNERNCCHCYRYNVAGGQVVKPFCRLEKALALGSVTDGTTTKTMARHLGYNDGQLAAWCPERISKLRACEKRPVVKASEEKP